MRTLGQAQLWLRAHVEDGVACPCCTQFAKVYRRKIHSTMARDLITAHGRMGLDPFHVPTLLRRAASAGDFAKLAYWRLIVEIPGVRDDGSTRVGWWRITDDGRLFALNQLRVPKYARIYDGRLIELDASDTVTIRDALGERFNYEELMRNA